MDSTYFTNPLVFLVQTLFDLYIIVVLVRLILQITRADFYNPVSQFIVKVTSQVLNPIRKVIPGYGGIDIASILLIVALKFIEIVILALILSGGLQVFAAIIWTLPALVELLLNFFLFAIFIQAILSWVSPDPYNPVMRILNSITQPVLTPLRNAIPAFSGIDLTPMIAIFVLYLAKMLILPPLFQLTGYPL